MKGFPLDDCCQSKCAFELFLYEIEIRTGISDHCPKMCTVPYFKILKYGEYADGNFVADS